MTPPRVLANSIPKAGTHLLQRCLTALPGLHDAGLHLDLRHPLDEMHALLTGLPAGAVATAHLPHEPRHVELVRRTGVAHLVIVRDPRDVAVSYSEYVPRAAHHYLHEHFLALDPDERLMAAIVGVPGEVPWDSVALRDVGAVFAQFTPWVREPGTLVVRFEDLVGRAGGGDDARQRAAVRAVAAHASLALDDAALDAAARRVYDTQAPTFRRGGHGEWRERFTPAHIEAFERVAGGLPTELGYEPTAASHGAALRAG